MEIDSVFNTDPLFLKHQDMAYGSLTNPPEIGGPPAMRTIQGADFRLDTPDMLKIRKVTVEKVKQKSP